MKYNNKMYGLINLNSKCYQKLIFCVKTFYKLKAKFPLNLNL